MVTISSLEEWVILPALGSGMVLIHDFQRGEVEVVAAGEDIMGVVV